MIWDDVEQNKPSTPDWLGGLNFTACRLADGVELEVDLADFRVSWGDLGGVIDIDDAGGLRSWLVT